jgi:hypothetical protein
VSHIDPNDETPPTIPPAVRTAAYIGGAVLGLGVAPALLSLGLTGWAGVAGALAGAANALAFGYRPTR